MTLNQKQFKNAMKIVAAAARIDELNRLEGYVPSSTISRRKNALKKQVEEILGKEKKEETEINIRIELPEEKVQKKENSVKFSLKNLLGGAKELSLTEDDDDSSDELIAVVKGILPVEQRGILGKVVTEL